jgi:hypothetical protein
VSAELQSGPHPLVALLDIHSYSNILYLRCIDSASVYVIIRIDGAVTFVALDIGSFSCFPAMLALEGESCNLLRHIINLDDFDIRY